MRYTRKTPAAHLLFMVVGAIIASVVLRDAGFSLVAHGSSPLPEPASRPVAKLVLKAIDANPMLLPPAKMASLYDYVTLTTGNAVFARQIKSANPNVKVLVYRTPHLIHTWEETWGTVNSHESWFMHDRSGRRAANDPENFVMDIRNPEFRAYEIRYIANLLNTYGFDGIFWDGPPGTLALLTLNPGPDPAAAQTWHQDILK